jgi:hypothetical protein
MSNYHLKDKALSLKSKGLLSLILSLPDEWNYTTRGLAAICREGVDCIGATLRELESTGYLERNQLRDDKGRIADTEYVTYEFPRGATGKDPPPGKPVTLLPDMPSPDTGFPYLDKPPTGNSAQYNTKSNQKTKKENTDSTTIHPSIPQAQDGLSDSSPMDGIDRFNYHRKLIQENIEYDCLCERFGRELLDSIVEIILDAVCAQREYISIGGADYPAEVVKGRLLSLTSDHIEYVIGCLKSNATKISKIDAYLLKCLYAAPMTIDPYYTTLVNYNMAHGFRKNE